MRKTRILIIDNDAASRRRLRDILANSHNLEVVGSAASGKIALEKIPQINPDVLILDLDFPGNEVIHLLMKIRKTYPNLPVITISPLNENKQAGRVLQALAAGANDYIRKPDSTQKNSGSGKDFRVEFFSKITRYFPLEKKQKTISPLTWEKKIQPRPQSGPVSSRYTCGVDILAIGVSTGGPQALAEILPRFPENFPVPIVIVQHMPVGFTSQLAQRLDSMSPVSVKEGQNGDVLHPGGAWIAPGGSHMETIVRNQQVELVLHKGPPENSCRPAADVLFRSVANCFGPRTLAVVLTGMGKDGLRGCEQIREAGGQILIQDERTSVVWGMAGALAQAGLADLELPLNKLPDEILTRVLEQHRGPRYRATGERRGL